MKNDSMKNQYRVNEQIRVREVRIVGEGGSTVVPTRQALDMAREQGVDLVEISPNANPPVCRLIDYSKFLYQQKKRQKEMKAKQVKVTIKGALKTPQVDGEIYLDSSYLVSVPYGMRMRFDNDPVRIVGSNLLFENFSLYSYNENPLTLHGSINFSNLDKILVDLRMRARDYQVISEKENPNSIAYGKAFVDIFGRIQGPLDNLNMRGRLNVLGSTDMSYVLRDTPLSTDNHLEELVKFTDFSDTAQIVVERPQLTGFSMGRGIALEKVSVGEHSKCVEG